MNRDLKELEDKIGVHFRSLEFLKTALTHRSYLNEHPKFTKEHNERLEFLGDSILEFVISEYLFRNLQKSEGEMTNIRAALVNAETLSQIGKQLKINDYLFLSKGERENGEKAKKYITANALEAIIGAIYLDQGFKVVKKFIIDKILVLLSEILKKNTIKDPKSEFQEYAQEKYNITPIYKVLKEWGPDHLKQFLIGVFLEEKLIAKGKGFSKQEAEEMAARKGLEMSIPKEKEY